MVKVVIFKRVFDSKKELKNFVSQMLNSLRIDKSKTYEIIGEDFVFFNELFRRHPEYIEKKGKGIEKIFVGPNPINRNYSHLTIRRVDGSSVDISWNICCSGINKNIKYIQAEICRKSISDQISEYHKSCPNICNICKSTSSEYEIDHINEFRNILGEFSKKYSLPSRCKETNFGHAFHDDDAEIENKWREYHKKEANLQKLCKSCHKYKTNKSRNADKN